MGSSGSCYFSYNDKHNNEVRIMDIKSMLVKLAEEQADKMQDQAVDHIGSNDFADKLAQLLNDKINIPFVKEEKEGVMFKELVEVIQSITIGLIKGK